MLVWMCVDFDLFDWSVLIVVLYLFDFYDRNLLYFAFNNFGRWNHLFHRLRWLWLKSWDRNWWANIKLSTLNLGNEIWPTYAVLHQRCLFSFNYLFLDIYINKTPLLFTNLTYAHKLILISFKLNVHLLTRGFYVRN